MSDCLSQSVYSHCLRFLPPAPPALQANISVVLVDNDTKISTLLSQRPRPLTHIVSTRPVKPELVQRAKDAGIRVSRLAEVEKLGAAANIKEMVRDWGTERWEACTGMGCELV